MAGYVPERGDVIWINCDPQAGHEQGGRRPSIVLSPRTYNRASGLALLCPITNRSKGYPFEVPMPDGFAVTGVVLVDQLKNMDWTARKATFIGKSPEQLLSEIMAHLRPLLVLDDE